MFSSEIELTHHSIAGRVARSVKAHGVTYPLLNGAQWPSQHTPYLPPTIELHQVSDTKCHGLSRDLTSYRRSSQSLPQAAVCRNKYWLPHKFLSDRKETSVVGRVTFSLSRSAPPSDDSTRRQLCRNNNSCWSFWLRVSTACQHHRHRAASGHISVTVITSTYSPDSQEVCSPSSGRLCEYIIPCPREPSLAAAMVRWSELASWQPNRKFSRCLSLLYLLQQSLIIPGRRACAFVCRGSLSLFSFFP